MFEINGVGIKCAQDLQEALLIVKHTEEEFIFNIRRLAERYGEEGALGWLYQALYGVEALKGLITATHELVDEFDSTGDPNAYYIREITKGPGSAS